MQLVSVEALDESGGGSGGAARRRGARPDGRRAGPGDAAPAQCAVAGLGERDRTVVRLYYLENRTLAEIGSLLGVTESRVCQLHARLVGRLRGRLEELAAG